MWWPPTGTPERAGLPAFPRQSACIPWPACCIPTRLSWYLYNTISMCRGIAFLMSRHCFAGVPALLCRCACIALPVCRRRQGASPIADIGACHHRICFPPLPLYVFSIIPMGSSSSPPWLCLLIAMVLSFHRHSDEPVPQWWYRSTTIEVLQYH